MGPLGMCKWFWGLGPGSNLGNLYSEARGEISIDSKIGRGQNDSPKQVHKWEDIYLKDVVGMSARAKDYICR